MGIIFLLFVRQAPLDLDLLLALVPLPGLLDGASALALLAPEADLLEPPLGVEQAHGRVRLDLEVEEVSPSSG